MFVVYWRYISTMLDIYTYCGEYIDPPQWIYMPIRVVVLRPFIGGE